MENHSSNKDIRATKIVATMGPALAERAMIEGAIAGGYINVVRMNFSHGEFSFHENNIKTVRELAKKYNRRVAILADLQGPKIRIKRFKDGKIFLKQGDAFTLSMKKDDLGDEHSVGVDYPDIINDCKADNILLLDDGKISLKITNISGDNIYTEVLDGGELSNNKGINLKGGGLRAPAITPKDREVIKFVSKLNVELMAVSFVRSGEDMRLVRSLAAEAKPGFCPLLVSKIERADIFNIDDPEDTKTLDDIIQASDGVMVARGDLAVEVGSARMVGLQKLIVRRAIENNTFVIMATQMMESMISESQPTRAEISDVGNAILDGADAIMFSAETAVGRDPLKTVTIADEVCRGSENLSQLVHRYELPERHKHTNQSLAHLAHIVASETKSIKAIYSFTHDGRTVLYLSRYRFDIPIYAITSDEYVATQLSVLGGVQVLAAQGAQDFNQFRKTKAQNLAKQWIKEGRYQEGDKLLFVFSMFDNTSPYWTNSFSILRIEDIAKGYISH